MATIPGIMVDIGANVARMQQDMKRIEGTMGTGFSNILKTARTFGGAFAGYLSLDAVGDLVKESFKAFAEQEAATNKLSVAMKNMGENSRGAMKDLLDFSNEIQNTTTVGDEAALGVMTLLKTFGMGNETIKRTTVATIDLSKVMGVDLDSAAKLLGKAYAGNTDALSRYGIIIDKTGTAAEKFSAVLTQVESRFGGTAQAEIETYGGKWLQLKNRIGEVSEAIGGVIAKIAFGPLEDAQLKALMGAEKLAIAFQSASYNQKKLVTSEMIQAVRDQGEAWELFTSQVQRFKPVSEETLRAIEKINSEMIKTNIQMQTIGKGNVEKQIAMLEIERQEYEKAGVEKAEINKLMAQKSALYWKQFFYDKNLAYDKSLLSDRDNLAEWETRNADWSSYVDETKRMLEWGKEEFRKAEEEKTAIAGWETRASADEYIAEMKRASEYGRQEYERIIASEKGIAPWETAVDDLDKYIGKIAEQNLILIDFGDRVRQQDLFTADYAIKQIERQAAIFRQAGADEVAVAIWASKEKQKASREWVDGAARAFEDYATAATDAAKNIEGVITSAFKTMEDVLLDFVKTGKLNFKSLVDSIITDLLRLMIRQNITGPMASGFGEFLASIFSSGGGPGAQTPGMAGYRGTGFEAAGWYHKGGIVGPHGASLKSFPAAYLMAAPRYHGGLQPDEFPTILKRGEGVFTPEQMSALGNKTSIAISIPITMSGGDARKGGQMRRDLENELEPIVKRIVERYS